jgi:hypothetical protein
MAKKEGVVRGNICASLLAVLKEKRTVFSFEIQYKYVTDQQHVARFSETNEYVSQGRDTAFQKPWVTSSGCGEASFGGLTLKPSAKYMTYQSRIFFF